MRIIWAPSAKRDRLAIYDYLASHDPVAAERIDGSFSSAVAQLVEFPMLGHPGEVSGTRELSPHRNYRLVYEVRDDTIGVVALIHSARRWPPSGQ